MHPVRATQSTFSPTANCPQLGVDKVQLVTSPLAIEDNPHVNPGRDNLAPSSSAETEWARPEPRKLRSMRGSAQGAWPVDSSYYTPPGTPPRYKAPTGVSTLRPPTMAGHLTRPMG